jgi:beta-glucosidase-like glycosyl hydrolase
VSLRDQIAADNAALLNTDEFGQAVTRWPKGHEGAAVSVTAIWQPETARRTASIEGEEIEWDGDLWLLSSVDVHRDDVWEIGDRTYQTIEVGEDEEGMRMVRLLRTEIVQRSRQRRNIV